MCPKFMKIILETDSETDSDSDILVLAIEVESVGWKPKPNYTL